MSCEVSDKSKNGSSKADHLNTRIPYGIRPVVKVRSYTLIVFQSTHPVWDATTPRRLRLTCLKFQSTHPVWDATRGRPPDRTISDISIHASRMGCDLSSVMTAWSSILFQSTHPVWDATCLVPMPDPRSRNFNPRIPYGMRRPRHARPRSHTKISIHVSRMGCDYSSA